MRRIDFLYAVLFSLLIFSLFSFLAYEENGGLPYPHKEENWIAHGWVVAAAYHPETGQDITALHASEIWKFMPGNSFILFKDRNVENKGQWEMKNGNISIKNEGTQESKTFRFEKKGRNELLLISNELKIRLLKLDDV